MAARVLVVDDEAEVRNLLREFLEHEGYTVDVAATAVAAIAKARAARPAVILLDLNMPGAVSGAAVVGALSAEAPVIVVTAQTDIDMARRTLIDGAFDFVAKPFTLHRVAELVDLAVLHGAR